MCARVWVFVWVCACVWVSIWRYLLRCHDTTVENRSVDLKAQSLSQVLPRPPKRTAGGRPFFVTPLPSGRAGTGSGRTAEKPLFSPLLVAGKALSTPSRTKQPRSDPSIGLFHSFWLRRSFQTTGDQGIRLGCGLDWKYALENTHWPLDHISPHPFADYKSLCGQGMPSTLLMAAKMWLPQGPEQNKYHSSPAQFKQARQMSVKVHSCSQWGWMHSVYIWKGDV